MGIFIAVKLGKFGDDEGRLAVGQKKAGLDAGSNEHVVYT